MCPLNFYNIGNIVRRTYFSMFHRSRCSLLQSLMLLSLSVSPSQLKLGRKGKERTLRSVAPCGRHVEIEIFDSVISTFFIYIFFAVCSASFTNSFAAGEACLKERRQIPITRYKSSANSFAMAPSGSFVSCRVDVTYTPRFSLAMAIPAASLAV